MGIKTKFFVDRGLLIDISTGDIQFSKLKEYQEALIQDDRISSIDKILSITTDASFNFSSKEIHEYISILKITTKDTNIRWAIVTSTPSATVLANLIELDTFYHDKVFVCSLIETAIRFLKISITESDLSANDFKQYF